MILFGEIVAFTDLAALAAVFSNLLSDRIRVTAPAIFLIVASAPVQPVPRLGRHSSCRSATW